MLDRQVSVATCSPAFRNLAWHRGVGPNSVEVPEAHVREALACPPFIEAPGEAEDQPGKGRQAHGDYAHHHGVDDITIAYQSAVEKCQAWRCWFCLQQPRPVGV